MRSNAGIVDRGTSTWASRKSPPPVSTLTWLDSQHSRPTTQAIHIKTRITSFDTSRRKKTMPDCPATMPHGPGTPPFSRARFPAALSPAPAPATTHYNSPWTSGQSTAHPGGTSSLVADWTPLHYTAAPLYATANTAGENPIAHKTKHGILAAALGNCRP